MKEPQEWEFKKKTTTFVQNFIKFITCRIFNCFDKKFYKPLIKIKSPITRKKYKKQKTNKQKINKKNNKSAQHLRVLKVLQFTI